LSDPIEIWIATRKGVFVARRSANSEPWSLTEPGLAGYEVYHVAPDPDDPLRAFAAANHRVWGQHVFGTGDGGATWDLLPDPEPVDGVEARYFWHLAAGPESGGQRRWYLGADPATIFASNDPRDGWEALRGLQSHPTRETWQVARGGMPLHSIQPDPRTPDRLYVAISAGGCYRSEDAGLTWTPINDGITATYLADPHGVAGHNPHSLRIHPARPDRLYRQGHQGLFRTDDRGESWMEITAGLPSDFGYAVGLHPRDPDRLWVIPEESSHMRCVCGGRLRVYESVDAGSTWEARTDGLPQRHAYLSVLRDGLSAGEGGIAFGTTTGQVFWSPDGSSWERLPGMLPTVLAVALRDRSGSDA
jgi:hypothetical protein